MATIITKTCEKQYMYRVYTDINVSHLKEIRAHSEI